MHRAQGKQKTVKNKRERVQFIVPLQIGEDRFPLPREWQRGG